MNKYLFYLAVITVIFVSIYAMTQGDNSKETMLSAKFLGRKTTLEDKCYTVNDHYEIKMQTNDRGIYTKYVVDFVETFGECR